jgi:hypothetical protein
MEPTAESKAVRDPQGGPPPIGDLRRQTVLHELENIISSQAFRKSRRSQEFLSFIVNRTLEGHGGTLKERIIGTNLFHRPSSYETGEDPVVRLNAREVRRRLVQHYHEALNSSPVRIEVPVGSYVPEFHWNPAAPPAVLATPPRAKNRGQLLLGTAISLGLALGLVLITIRPHYWRPQVSLLDQFWSPVCATSQPVLICLSKPVLYRPSQALYQRYSEAHPGTFQTEYEKSHDVLPFDPNDKFRWRDMVPNPSFGVAIGDVYAAFQVSAVLAHINKPTRLRIGDDYSFRDLSSSPSVLVGAFGNRWTLQMTSTLRFVFGEDNERKWVEERGPPRRVWSVRRGPTNVVGDDFGVVSRLLNSKSGQVVIVVAGLGTNGTEAAARLISTEDFLGESLRTAPPDWQKKNLQMVIQTSVIDNVAGPPRVVATFFW